MASNRFLKAATKIVKRQFFAKGAQIFAEGDPSDHAFFVQTGAVLLSMRTDTRITPHSTVREKQIFGEMALLEEQHRAMSATAIVDTTCILILNQEFKRKLEDTDPLVKALLRVLARSLSEIDFKPSWEEFKKREKKS